MPRYVACFILAVLLGACADRTSGEGDHGTLVVVVGQEASLPIPTLISGAGNRDVADLLFLRLADLGPELQTSGDDGFVPRLAESWERVDSLTLTFHLDNRARWHDGAPITARDVAFSFDLFRDPAIAPSEAQALERLASVTPEAPDRVTFTFHTAYSEQVYDLAYHVQILPAHLLDTIPHDRLASSAFAQSPVGSGPYRWGHRDPGRQVELLANQEFFLGSPRIDRVVFLLARDPDAQLNLLLDGTADALQNIAVNAVPRIASQPDLTVLQVPTFRVGYLLFNLHAPGTQDRPHPMLADRNVRRAVAMGLDRSTLVAAVLGSYGSIPEGPVGVLHWFKTTGTPRLPFDTAAANALLDQSDWRDSDGDGIRDRGGLPLRLQLTFPGTNVIRSAMAPLVQAQLRQIGIQIDLVRLDGPVWLERRNRGDFDLDFSQAGFDPSPQTMSQGFACAASAGANVGGFCDHTFDSLVTVATTSPDAGADDWGQAVHRLVDEAPAVFLYGLTNAMVLHRRFDQVTVPPTSYWSDVWRWSVRPGEQLPRDRSTDPE